MQMSVQPTACDITPGFVPEGSRFFLQLSSSKK
jgi:hypothetical protein